MSINERIKEFRKLRHFTQAEFGEKIGIKKSAISKMEQEGAPITEQNIKFICEIFHLRREWLVHGTGEMYDDEKETDPIMLWAEKLTTETGDSFPRRLATCFAKFSPDEWDKLESILNKILAEMSDPISKEEQQRREIDAKVEAYRRQLLAEAAQKGEESSISAAPAPKKRA